jgi:hypothetical protein
LLGRPNQLERIAVRTGWLHGAGAPSLSRAERVIGWPSRATPIQRCARSKPVAVLNAVSESARSASSVHLGDHDASEHANLGHFSAYQARITTACHRPRWSAPNYLPAAWPLADRKRDEQAAIVSPLAASSLAAMLISSLCVSRRLHSMTQQF